MKKGWTHSKDYHDKSGKAIKHGLAAKGIKFGHEVKEPIYPSYKAKKSKEDEENLQKYLKADMEFEASLQNVETAIAEIRRAIVENEAWTESEAEDNIQLYVRERKNTDGTKNRDITLSLRDLDSIDTMELIVEEIPYIQPFETIGNVVRERIYDSYLEIRDGRIKFHDVINLDKRLVINRMSIMLENFARRYDIKDIELDNLDVMT